MLDNALLKCLKEEDLLPNHQQVAAFERHFTLIRMWNKVVSLVSKGDLEHNLIKIHLPDSLSLAGSIQRCIIASERPPIVLDIGSGGGFPAIPLAIMLPHVHFHLVDRSTRKRGFLLKLKGDLGLANVEVHEGVFPEVVPVEEPVVLTARAVEKPEVFLPMIADGLPEGCTFMCQHRTGTQYFDPAMFHVEPVVDNWSKTKLRRGELNRITRKNGAFPD